MALRIGVVETPPAMTTNCWTDPRCTKRGAAIDAAMIACDHLKLTCTFARFIGGYGDYVNGTATGMIGAIMRNEFDTAIPIFSPNPKRFQALDFSDANFVYDVVLVTRGQNAFRDFIDWRVIQAFQWPVWIAFLVALCSTALFISLDIQKLTNRYRDSREHYSIFYLETVFSLITNKPKTDLVPDAVRLAIALWTLGMVAVTSAYTGVLFSQKLARMDIGPFNDYESFLTCLEEGKCRVISPTYTSNSMLDQLTAPEGGGLANRTKRAFEKTGFKIAPAEEIPKAILNETEIQLVWITGKERIYALTNGNKDCSYHIVDIWMKQVFAYPVRKNSTLLQKLNRVSVSLTENGIGHKVLSKYTGMTTACDESRLQRNGNTVSIGSVLSVVYFYAVGISAAFICLAVELVMDRWCDPVHLEV